MSTLIRRGNRWQAQVSVNGVRAAKTFNLRSDALKWARTMELEPLQPVTREGRMTLVQLLLAYREAKASQLRLSFIDRHPIGAMQISQIKAQDIDAFLDSRLEAPGRQGRIIQATSLDQIRRTLRGAFGFAVKRGWIAENPCKTVHARASYQFRERVPTDEEYERLKQAAYWDGSSYPLTLAQKAVAAFRFSMLTGMRAGEICAIESSWIAGRVIHLPAEATKTKTGRAVALSTEALALLETMLTADLTPVWGITNTQRNTAFCRIRNMAGLGDVRDSAGRLIQSALHFHDARAYFCTWAASRGENGRPRLEPFELARQLGNQSLTMTMRYYRLTPDEIAKKLG